MLRGLQELNNDNCDSVCDPLPQKYTNDLKGCCDANDCYVDHENNSCRSKNITPPRPVPDGNKSGTNAYNNCKQYVNHGDEDGFSNCCVRNCCENTMVTADCKESNCFTTCHNQAGILPPQPIQPQPSGPQPIQPQPSGPQPSGPQPSDKCKYFKSLQTGNCINLTKDTKWTDDVYHSLIKATQENARVTPEVATCIVNKMTQEFDSPLSAFAQENETKIHTIRIECAKCNGECGGKPKLYRAKSSPGPGKNKTTDYVFIGLIGLCILIFVGMLLSNSVRQNKTRLTVVVITIAILITVFVALLYTTIHKK